MTRDLVRERLRPLASLALGALALSAYSCGDATGAGTSGPDLLWRTPLAPQLGTSDERPATDGQRLYAVAGGMVAFDASSGAMVWTHPVQYTVPRNAVVRGGRVLAAEGLAFALDAATGRELWRFTPDAHGGFGESTADDRAFYFGTASHTLYALDAATGVQLWSRDLGPDWTYTGIVTGVAVSGDTVYAAAEQFNAQNGYVSTGWLFALDRMDGRVLWSYRNGSGSERDAGPACRTRLYVARNKFWRPDRRRFPSVRARQASVSAA